MGHVVADIHFFDKGGRRGPVVSGYRAKIHLPDRTIWSCQATFSPRWLELGETREASIVFLSEEPMQYMKPWMEVELVEGPTKVGILVVKEVRR